MISLNSFKILLFHGITNIVFHSYNDYISLHLHLIAVVVNMILINMMMAIINLAFEEIKENRAQYQSKFELMEYVKR